MTIQETHRAVLFGLQRQAGAQYTSVESEEVDIALNIAQDRFLDNELNPTSQTTDNFSTVSRRSLSTLIVKNYSATALKPISYEVKADSYDGHIYEEDMYYCNLPTDYLYPINQRVKVSQLIDNQCLELSIEENDEPAYREYIAYLPYVANVDDVCVPSPVLKITMEGDTLFDLTDFPAMQDVYNDVRDQYKVIDVVLEFLNRYNSLSELINYANPSSNVIEHVNKPRTFTVYWETYKDMHYPSSFIFVTTEEGRVSLNNNPFDADYNGNDYGKELALITDEDGVTPQSTMRFQQKTFYKVKPDSGIYPNNKIESVERVVRIMGREDFYIKSRNPFWRTSSNDVIGYWENKRLMIYTDKSFVPVEAKLDFIRRPRRMNLLLGWSCELPEFTHKAIVEHAIAYLLELSTNPRLQSNVAQRTYYGE